MLPFWWLLNPLDREGRQSGSSILVGNPGSLNNRDQWMRDRLEDGGWAVAIVDDNATTSGSASGKQVVVISESVGGSGLTTAATALGGVAVPIVAAESYIFDELRMTGTGSNQGNTSNSQNSVDITAAGAGHPLGAGFAADPGELRALRLGRRLVVPRAALEELLGVSPAAVSVSDDVELPC